MKKNENLENNLFLRWALKHVISAWQYILIGSARQDEYLSGFDPLPSPIMIHSRIPFYSQLETHLAGHRCG